jgi:predicted xylose isomerase-like sugar epimerase
LFQVLIAGDSGSSVLRTSDIGLRFNNWDRVRGQRLPLFLSYAAISGAAALMFGLILTDRLAYRGETEPAARQAR